MNEQTAFSQKEYNREYQRENCRWLHKQGRCVVCKKRDAYTMAGRHRCFECNEKFRQWQSKRRKTGVQEKENSHARQRYVERKAAGLCVQCGKSTHGNGKARCSHCLEINRKAVEKQHRKKNPSVNLPRGDNGICYLCNKEPVFDDKKVCQNCYKILCGLTKVLNDGHRDNSEHIWRKLDHAAAMRRRSNDGKTEADNGGNGD